jgi:arylsulfatase
VGQFLQTFKDYPPSQVGGWLSVESALHQLEKGAGGQ